MNGEEVKAPAFCPVCGARVRRSIAERIGIKQDDLAFIIIVFVVFFSIVAFTAVITYGIVVRHQNYTKNEQEMAKAGYVQTTKCLDPSTNLRNGKYVTEWAKPEVPKEEAKKP